MQSGGALTGHTNLPFPSPSPPAASQRGDSWALPAPPKVPASTFMYPGGTPMGQGRQSMREGIWCLGCSSSSTHLGAVPWVPSPQPEAEQRAAIPTAKPCTPIYGHQLSASTADAASGCHGDCGFSWKSCKKESEGPPTPRSSSLAGRARRDAETLRSSGRPPGALQDGPRQPRSQIPQPVLSSSWPAPLCQTPTLGDR